MKNISFGKGSFGISWEIFLHILETRIHLMAVPYEHIAFSTDLTIEHLKELELVHKFVAKYFAGRNYFSFTRESLSWRSVEHLHMHFLPWIIQGKYLRHMLMNQWFPIKQDL